MAAVVAAAESILVASFVEVVAEVDSHIPAAVAVVAAYSQVAEAVAVAAIASEVDSLVGVVADTMPCFLASDRGYGLRNGHPSLG